MRLKINLSRTYVCERLIFFRIRKGSSLRFRVRPIVRFHRRRAYRPRCGLRHIRSLLPDWSVRHWQRTLGLPLRIVVGCVIPRTIVSETGDRGVIEFVDHLLLRPPSPHGFLRCECSPIVIVSLTWRVPVCARMAVITVHSCGRGLYPYQRFGDCRSFLKIGCRVLLPLREGNPFPSLVQFMRRACQSSPRVIHEPQVVRELMYQGLLIPSWPEDYDWCLQRG